MCRPVLAVVLAFLCLSPAFAAKVQFNSDPAGATVQIVGPVEAVRKLKVSSGVTPVVLDLPRNAIPFEVVFSKSGYETTRLLLNTKESLALTGTLPQLVDERPLEFRSTPAGAEVLINGTAAGVAPVTRPVRFERPNSREPWSAFEIVFRKADYQEEKISLTRERAVAAKGGLAQELGRIAEKRDYEIRAVDEQGAVIPKAEVLVNGKSAAQTDERGVAKISLPFSRPDRTAAWAKFEVTAVIPDEYKPVTKSFTLETPARVEFPLVPVTEVMVKRMFPGTEMTSRGPRLQVDTSEWVGVLNDRDLNSPAIELRVVSNHIRKSPTLQAINSFTVTPDGRNLIYAVTGQNEDGKYYSNLFLKGVQSASSPVTQLTRGTRFLDMTPAMSSEEGGTLLVFQSTRGVPETWDLSAIRLEGPRVVGGVQQLTRDTRFNYGPTLASEQQPVFFACLDEQPRSVARIASVRVDGSTFTNHGEIGDSLCYSSGGLLYLARPDAQSGRLQIYSIAIEGQTMSTVISDEQFAKSNCNWPAISPSGDQLLFASDYAADETGRKNNNIFLCDLKRGTILQLTDNGSDDILPKWSPTEPGVLYFLSNRAGVYNIWRMSFRLGQ